MLTNNFRTTRLANNWIRSSCARSERSWRRTTSYLIERISKNLLFNRDSIFYYLIYPNNDLSLDEIVINLHRLILLGDRSHSIFAANGLWIKSIVCSCTYKRSPSSKAYEHCYRRQWIIGESKSFSRFSSHDLNRALSNLLSQMNRFQGYHCKKNSRCFGNWLEKRSERRIIAVKGGNRRVVRVGDKLGAVCPLRSQ